MLIKDGIQVVMFEYYFDCLSKNKYIPHTMQWQKDTLLVLYELNVTVYNNATFIKFVVVYILFLYHGRNTFKTNY